MALQGYNFCMGEALEYILQNPPIYFYVKTVNFEDVQSLYGSQYDFVIILVWRFHTPLTFGVQNSWSNEVKL